MLNLPPEIDNLKALKAAQDAVAPVLKKATAKTRPLVKHITDTFRLAFDYFDRKPIEVQNGRNKRLNEKPDDTQFTGDTAALWVGKVFKGASQVAPKNLLIEPFGFTTDTRIYNRGFLEAGADYFCQHTEPGGVVRVILCSRASELLNGRKDTVDTLSDNEVRHILLGGMNRGVNGVADEDLRKLQICHVDELPGNVSLFEQLRTCADPQTGAADIDASYSTDETLKFSEDPSALDIAQLLYAACKKNEKLAKAFKRLKPGRVKNDPDAPEASNYYGLTEVAIRLRAILDGCFIHGGAERQDMYDDLIAKIVKGKNQNGDFRKFTELFPLYDVLDRKTFVTAHIKKTNSFGILNERKLAEGRMWVYLHAAAWIAAGGCTAKRYICDEYPFNTLPIEANATDPEISPELPAYFTNQEPQP